MLQSLQGQSERVAQLLALLFLEWFAFGVQSPQTSVGPLSDARYHLHIAQQFLEGGGCCWGLDLLLHFQKQLRLFKKALPDSGRSFSPSGIQLPGLPARKLVPRKRGGHLLTVLEIRARHGHQILHRHLRGDLARAHLLLHAVGKQLDQGQATRYPTHTAIELASQFLQAIAEPLLQLRQQPALFQGAVGLRPTQRAVQHQSLDFAQRPEHRFDRVPAELLESRDALVTVDDQIVIWLIRHSDDHDRRLLSRSGQRSQQLPLPLWRPHPQRFITAVQLMKLELHLGSLDRSQNRGRRLRKAIKPCGTYRDTLR